ncbi:hypothetical protein [Bacillus proteolyticus]|uniref:hypothetical protein n=1 Tax=Bacillus proteolyticus TaxID=2026192 RepID=UPI0030F41222
MRNAISVLLKVNKRDGKDINTFFKTYKAIEEERGSAILEVNIEFDPQNVKRVFDSNSGKLPKLLLYNKEKIFAVADIIEITKIVKCNVGERSKTLLKIKNLEMVDKSNALEFAILAFRINLDGTRISLKESINDPNSVNHMRYITWPDY